MTLYPVSESREKSANSGAPHSVPATGLFSSIRIMVKGGGGMCKKSTATMRSEEKTASKVARRGAGWGVEGGGAVEEVEE